MTNFSQRWVLYLILTAIIASVAGWWFSRDKIPDVINIATGVKGGQYYAIAEYIKPHLETATGSSVIIRETAGSIDNAKLLQNGDVDFAILQLGPIGLGKESLITPLYPEIVHVLVRASSDIQQFSDLRSRTVAISTAGSGMHVSAKQLLTHYTWDLESKLLRKTHFLELERDTSLDAAIVTAGFMNPDLRRVLSANKYRLIPIDSADGLTLRQPFFSKYVIPKGLFRGGTQAVPAKPTPTISTMAVLVAQKAVSPALVDAILKVIYSSKMVYKFPGMLNKKQAAAWDVLPKLRASVMFFNPFEGIDLLASMMESLAAGKELLFAFGAALYLLWDLSHRRKAKRIAQTLVEQKERLDTYLEKTIIIERNQLDELDSDTLLEYLNEVTKIKLEALEEFTHEDLRADHSFSIFLMQCANLIIKIQFKINVVNSKS